VNYPQAGYEKLQRLEVKKTRSELKNLLQSFSIQPFKETFSHSTQAKTDDETECNVSAC
jgi:hypothetical protein